MAARARLLGALVVLMALGGGIGAGIAALLGRPAQDGLAVGVITACVVAVIYLLFVLSMVVGLGLMSLTRQRAEPDGPATSRSRDAVVATLWVVAAFVAIIAALVLGASALTWIAERG